jgi:carboxyl-terminal processing protease
MQKAILWTLGIFIIIGLIAGAFAGGVVVGGTVDLFDRQVTVPETWPETLEAQPEDDETPQETEAEATGTEDATATPEDDATTPADNNAALDPALLQEVLTLLERDFYGEIPDKQSLTHGAIRGLLMTLDDPYTSFVEPNIADVLREDATGQFEGIGATVQMREDGFLEIVRPLPGHPAEEVGLKAGDLILTVDGTDIVGMGLYEAIGLIRGPAGTEVELEIARPGQEDTFFVTITRASIEMPIVESEMLENDIAYISLTEFDATARERVENELKELFKNNPQGLIFDLRNNPGGFLSQAIQVSDLFLEEGLIAIERDSRGEEKRFYSYDNDAGEEIPLVVLINGGSASASEIVAGALQDRDRAMLIGQETLGKGSVQLPHDLSDGSQLRVTIARWFTPNNNSIHEQGLTPDIEVPYPNDTPVDEDPQLDRALEYFQEN